MVSAPNKGVAADRRPLKWLLAITSRSGGGWAEAFGGRVLGMLCPSGELCAVQYESLLSGLMTRGLTAEHGPVDSASGEACLVVRRGRARQRLYVTQVAHERYRVWLSYDLTWPWRWPAEARVYGDIFDAFFEVAQEGRDSDGGSGSGSAGA